MSQDTRVCALDGCDAPIPAGSRASRRFCSTYCGQRDYALRNPDVKRATRRKYDATHREQVAARRKANTDHRAKYARAIEMHGRDAVLAAIRTDSLRRRYGLTEEEYDALLVAQGGTCAICPKTFEENGRRLAVDHDHACCPGRESCGRCVRGLLCTVCNHRLGVLEQAEWMTAATKYLDVSRDASRRVPTEEVA